MYCEQTDIEQKTYAIQYIPEPLLQQLAKLLTDLNDPEFKELQKVVSTEAKDSVVYRYFNQKRTEIEFCTNCEALGYLKDEHPIVHGEFKIAPCHICNGQSSRVKHIFVKYETIDEDKKKRFASDGFKNKTSTTA